MGVPLLDTVVQPPSWAYLVVCTDRQIIAVCLWEGALARRTHAVKMHYNTRTVQRSDIRRADDSARCARRALTGDAITPRPLERRAPVIGRPR